MDKVLPTFTFILGMFVCWVFMDKYNGNTFDLWTEAYTVGKDDGYRLGYEERDINDYPWLIKEHMCMFLYKDH